MRLVVGALLLLVAGCKDKAKPSEVPAAGSGSAVPIDHFHVDAAVVPAPPVDWAACEKAVTAAASAPWHARPKILLDGCQVCGDWGPILNWHPQPQAGGPPRAAIEAAMERCAAYCVGMARDKFLGTLDDARGTASRMPWKQLALVCKERVSAVPDDRFVDGAFFALDRIGRAIGTHGGDLATQAFALDLPLSPVSVTGADMPLPSVTGLEQQAVADIQITVLAGVITIGPLPRARLSANGVVVALGSDAYPGKTVTVNALAGELTRLMAGDKTKPVALLASASLKAELLVPVIAAASVVAPLNLAVRAAESPPDWTLPQLIPVRLDGRKDAEALKVTHDMTVQQLADELTKPRKANRVGITGP
jgi:hypothetical protein